MLSPIYWLSFCMSILDLICIKKLIDLIFLFFYTVGTGSRIVIILDLDVLLEKYDPIGKPMPLQMHGAAISPPIYSSMPSFNSGRRNQGGASSTARPVSASSVVPKPDPSVNAHMPQSEFNYAVSSRPHGSSLGNNMESHRYNSLDSQPQYSRTDSNLGLTHTPINNNVSPPHASYQQMNPVAYNRRVIGQNEAFASVIPIAALNPYQSRWTIKARVTTKGELRHFNKPGGEGKVFSFELLDSDGDEIKATCFNTAADQFYNQIEQGKVYTVSKGSVRPARKNYNHLCNDYEIFLEKTSDIQPCFDDILVPKMKFRFRSIREIQGIEKESVVDVIGLVSSISPSVPVFRKNGSETQKRTLQLKDMSGMSIDVTLWGNFCNKEGHTLQNMYDSGAFPVLAIKSCKVNDFKGKSLGTLSASQLLIEPDFPEACELKAWFERVGKSAPSISISIEKDMDMVHSDVRKTISQIKYERMGTSAKSDWITVCATLTFIKADNVVYSACPVMVGDRKCHKKVISIGDGKWRCDRCCRVVDECEYRYALQFQIQDHTGLAWVTGFQESGEDIFGVPARDLYCLKYEKEDDDKFADILHFAQLRKYLFKLRVKEETFGDEQRVNSTASKVGKVNFASDTKYLLNLISKLKAQNDAPSAGPLTPFNSTSLTSGSGVLGTLNAAMNYGGSSGSVIKEHAPSVYLAGPCGNQSNDSRPASSPSTVMYLRCSSCGGIGHRSTNCPSPLNPQGQCHGGNVGNMASTRGTPDASIECFKCRQVGHWEQDCPTVNNLPPADGNITRTKYLNISRQQKGNS